MSCTQCKIELNSENKVPKRNLCKPCYNKNKQESKPDLPEREGTCNKCGEFKTILKGKYECKECKNERERERRKKFTDEKKSEVSRKNQQYYFNHKEEVEKEEIVINENEPKTCSVCKKEKLVKDFYLHKSKGTIRAECKECAGKQRIEDYNNNKEAIIKQNTEYQEKKKKNDPAFKKQKEIQTKMYIAMSIWPRKREYKTKLTEYLGCDFKFIHAYIEGKFLDGMTWENRGSGENCWQLDHKIPQCEFDFNDEEEIKKCWNYKNLQPIWVKAHKQKRTSILTEEEIDELNNNNTPIIN